MTIPGGPEPRPQPLGQPAAPVSLPAPYPVSPPPQVVVVPPPPSRPTSGMAVASMVLGIVGLTICLCFTFGIPSILAVIFGHLGLKETRPGGKGGHGYAVAGLVTGYIGIGPAVLLSVWVIVLGAIGGISGTPTPSPTY